MKNPASRGVFDMYVTAAPHASTSSGAQALLHQLGHRHAHDPAVVVGVGQAQRQPLGEQAVELAGERAEPRRGHDDVQAVGLALPCQTDKLLQQVALAALVIAAEGLDQLADVVDQQQQSRLGLLGLRGVVLGQCGGAGQTEQALAAVRKRFGAPWGLVNAAALDSPPDSPPEENGPFETYPVSSWERVMDVNVKGVFLACQVFGRAMAAAKGGSIINIGSTYGLVSPDQRIYEYRAKRGKKFFVSRASL